MAQEYPVQVRRLSDEEGGGYLAEVPDLPGCVTDGETAVEALERAEDAIQEWIETAKEMGRDVPAPGELMSFSGRWVVRMPKSLHMQLAERAKREGVSLNMLAVTLLAGRVSKEDDARS